MGESVRLTISRHPQIFNSTLQKATIINYIPLEYQNPPKLFNSISHLSIYNLYHPNFQNCQIDFECDINEIVEFS